MFKGLNHYSAPNNAPKLLVQKEMATVIYKIAYLCIKSK